MRYSLPWFVGVATAVALVMVNDRFFYESIEVISSSMEPSLLPKERIFLKRFGNRAFSRFDVVVVKNHQFTLRIVKRVIGLPGECVQLKDGWRVSVGPKELHYLPENPNADVLTEEGKHLIQLKPNPKIHYDTRYGVQLFCLGPDEYYLLGDNRLASGDSRFYGPFKVSEIEGTLKWIWYSFDKGTGRLRKERLGMTVH